MAVLNFHANESDREEEMLFTCSLSFHFNFGQDVCNHCTSCTYNRVGRREGVPCVIMHAHRSRLRFGRFYSL